MDFASIIALGAVYNQCAHGSVKARGTGKHALAGFQPAPGTGMLAGELAFILAVAFSARIFLRRDMANLTAALMKCDQRRWSRLRQPRTWVQAAVSVRAASPARAPTLRRHIDRVDMAALMTRDRA